MDFILYKDYFSFKRIITKNFLIFDQNHGLTPLEKFQFGSYFKGSVFYTLESLPCYLFILPLKTNYQKFRVFDLIFEFGDVSTAQTFSV